jgi:hypothetical protein
MMATMRIGTYATCVFAAVLALALPATAQPAHDHATKEADRLFNQGRAQLEAGKLAEACSSFERSLATADALGTRLNLALCYEKRGWVHTALTQFEDTANKAQHENHADSEAVARQHVEQLRPLIPHLTFTLTEPAPGQTVALTRPGRPTVAIIGPTTIPLDPTDPADPQDTIVILATAPDREAWQSEPVVVARGVTVPVTVPKLAMSPARGDVLPPPPPAKSRRKLYGILTGASGALVMLGSTLWAKSVSDSLTNACARMISPCDSGMDSYKSSSQWTNLHIVAPTVFFVGVAAVGFGTYLYLTAPKHRSARTAVVPTVGPDGGGISVLRRF